MEIWKDIKGYEGLYQVSNMGRIKSLKYNKEKILDYKPDNNGYIRVNLCKNGEKESFYVHRLVAENFLPNPNNLSEVNHKIDDFEHRSDNRVENLEWCTHDYNVNYGNRNKRISKKMKGSKNHMAKKVKCITTNEIFNTMKEAGEKYNIKNTCNITQCCKGKRKSAGKHPITGKKLVWEYVE